MKRAFKLTLVFAGVACAVVLGILVYVLVRYPDAGLPPQGTVAPSQERMERGRYLANYVAVCIDCHSTRDWSRFSGPPVPGTEGIGGFRFDESAGFPGTFYAKNITPTGIGTISDGQLLHAITSGIGKDGEALFPLMPYPAYTKLSEEDLASIVVYIRSLPPGGGEVPERNVKFPLSLLLRMIPAPHTPQPAPDTSTITAYGEYLTNAASCITCHTEEVGGKLVAGKEFAGGRPFPMPDGVVRSVNITRDEETGIGLWTSDIFVAKFKAYENADSSALDPRTAGYNTVMPWTMYARMTERDLHAIYAYLQTVRPVKHLVERFTPYAQ